jgi:hypothetical protein
MSTFRPHLADGERRLEHGARCRGRKRNLGGRDEGFVSPLGEVGGIDMVLKVLTRVRLITVVVGLTFGFVIEGCGGDEDPAGGAFDRVPGSVEAGVSDAADDMGEQYDEAATEPVELGNSSGWVIEDAVDESEKSARVAGDATTGSGDSATSDAPEVWTD